MVIRALVGRGWGQGPQHSQSFHHLFAQIPGFQVFYPVGAADYTEILKKAMENGPSVILEPRRCFEQPIFERPFRIFGATVQFVTFGDVFLDAVAAADVLAQEGIIADLLPVEDLSNPPILNPRLPTVVCDVAPSRWLPLEFIEELQMPATWIMPPFTPCPTSYELEKKWYPDAASIVRAALALLGKGDLRIPEVAIATDGFRGPF